MLAFCLKIPIHILNSQVHMGENSLKIYDLKCLFCALHYPNYAFRIVEKKTFPLTLDVMIL